MLVLISFVSLASAEDGNWTVVSETPTEISNNVSCAKSILETTPVTTAAVLTENSTLLQTINPTLPAIISPVPTKVVETTSVETITIKATDTATSPTPIPTLVNETKPAITIKPVLQRKSIPPSVQRKISTNLRYIIDSNAPQTGPSRDAVQNEMQAEGKLKTIAESPSSDKAGLRTPAAPSEMAENLVLVYIEIVPSASTSDIDTYVSTVTERSEEDHSIIAWININNLDSIASLDIVNNIRIAEPTVTKDSPVYYDTKFVNKRAGLPPATAEEAKVSVREFQKTPVTTLELKGTMKTPRGENYQLVSENDWYTVNANTGAVETAVFLNAQKSVNLQKISPPSLRNTEKNSDMTMDQAFEKAQDYAGINYRNFYSRTMVLTGSRLVDHGSAGKTYYFTWREKINNVILPNLVDISINPENGEIISYIGIDQPLNIDIIPTISRDVALQKSIDAFAPIEIVKNDSILTVMILDRNETRLVWLTEIEGAPKNFIHTGGRVLIDAHTGETVSVNRVS